MIRKRYLRKTLLAAVVFCIVPLYLTMVLREGDLNHFLLYSVGGGSFSSLSGVQTLLLIFIPPIVLYFLLSDFLSCDFDAMAIYIFTRAPKPMKYLNRKILYLVGCIAGYTCLSVLATVCIGLIGGYSADGFHFSLFIGEVVLFFLQNLMMVGLIQVLSLRIKSHYSFLTVSSISIVSVLIVPFLKGSVQKVIYFVHPLCQGFYAWHQEAIPYLEETMGVLPSFPVFYSVLYLLLLLVLEYFLLYQTIKHADFV